MSFQLVQYIDDDGAEQYGYRFVWINPDERQARRQAIIPSIEWINELVNEAKNRGWGDREGCQISF